MVIQEYSFMLALISDWAEVFEKQDYRPAGFMICGITPQTFGFECFDSDRMSYLRTLFIGPCSCDHECDEPNSSAL